MDTSFAVLEGVAALAAGDVGGGGAQDVLRYLQAPELGELAKCLETAPPDPRKRQKLAQSQPLVLRGKEQALQPRTARLVAQLSDELQLDEEAALDFVARVTERQHRRDLAGMTGRAEAFDGDVGAAARQLFYFEAACSLRALGEIVRGSLDPALPEHATRALQTAVRSLATQNLGGSLLAAVKRLASSSWAHPADRALRAGEFASLISEAHYYGFYEVQLEAGEAKELLETTRDVSHLLDEACRPQQVGQLAPHASRLRGCRDVLLLGALNALDAGAKLRDRSGATDDSLLRYGATKDDSPRANALVANAAALRSTIQAWPAALGLEARGAKAAANLAAALLARPARWADATADVEDRVRGALQDAFEGGVCCFLTRTHGLLRGDLRDGNRAPLTYLAAFTDVLVAAIEAALEVDALPEPSEAHQPGDCLEDVLELVRVLCGRFPQVCDRFFSSDDMDEEAPSAALAHLTLRTGDAARHGDNCRAPYLRLLAAVARGSERCATAVADFLRSDEEDQADRTRLDGLFLDGAAPPPGYGLRHFAALIERYGEVLRASELETQLATTQPAATYAAAPPAPKEPLWLGGADAEALAAVADVLAACMRTPAHARRVCAACATDAAASPARLAASALRLVCRDGDAVAPDLKGALFALVAACAQADADARASIASLVEKAVLTSSTADMDAPPASLRLPRQLVPHAPPAPPQQMFPGQQPRPPRDPLRDNCLAQQLSSVAKAGVVERDCGGVETRLRTFSGSEGYLRLIHALGDALDDATRRSAVRFASRDILLRCAARDEGQILAFRFRDERWRLACRALAVLRQALDAYDSTSVSWKRDFDPKSPAGASAGFAVLYDALSDRGALAASLASLIAAAGKEAQGDATFAPDNVTDAREFLPESRPKSLVDSEATQKRGALRAELDVLSVERARKAGLGGAGVAWWRTRCERQALDLLEAIMTREASFAQGCRASADSPAQRALVRAARGPPRRLGDLLLASRAPALQSSSSGSFLRKDAFGSQLEGWHDDDVVAGPFFEAPLASLLPELAKRAQPGAACTAGPAIRLLGALAGAALDGGRFLAALAAAEDKGADSRAKFAARVASAGDRRVVEEDPSTTADADGLPPLSAPGDAGHAALDLLVEPRARHLAGWLLDGGALEAAVDVAVRSSTALRSGGELETAERSLRLVAELATTTRGAVDAVCRDGDALVDLVATVHAACCVDVVSVPTARCLAAALECLAVCTHAAKLPGGVADASRGRCRAAVDAFLRADVLAAVFAAPFKIAKVPVHSDAVPAAARAFVEGARPATTSPLYENYDVVDEATLDVKLVASALDAPAAARVRAWAAHANQAQRGVTAAARVADAAQRLACVCGGYAFESAALEASATASTIAFRADDDREPADALALLDEPYGDLTGLARPRWALAEVRDAAARALTTYAAADARPAESLARCAADAAANLRSLDELARSRTVGGARQLALALDRPPRAMSEALRGHLYAALAHTLARARNRDPQTATKAADAVGERAWGRVCADAATAATPWVRLAARAALCEGAPEDGSMGRGSRAALAADALTHGGFRGCATEGPLVDAAALEASCAALLKLCRTRDAAARVADAGAIDSLAACGAFAPPDVDGGGLRSGLLALELVRSLLRRLPAHQRLRSSAQKHCCARAADVGRQSLAQALLAVEAPPRDLGHLRGRAALVGVISELARGNASSAAGTSPQYAPLKEHRPDVLACHSRCWRLLTALAADAEPERAGWWLACLPSNARERKNAANSTAFDDAKRVAHDALWVRLADFAKNASAAGGPAVDVEVLAASCRRGAEGSGDAASFALEAGLVALKDALLPPTDVATASAALRCAPLLRDTFRNVPVLRDADPDGLLARLVRVVGDSLDRVEKDAKNKDQPQLRLGAAVKA